MNIKSLIFLNIASMYMMMQDKKILESCLYESIMITQKRNKRICMYFYAYEKEAIEPMIEYTMIPTITITSEL